MHDEHDHEYMHAHGIEHTHDEPDELDEAICDLAAVKAAIARRIEARNAERAETASERPAGAQEDDR